MTNPMIGLWARTALVWLLLTMSAGMYFGITQQFQYASAHAHMGVLGWVSAGLFAFIHLIADREGALGSKARIHWWMHIVGLVIMASALYLIHRTGDDFWSPVIGAGGAIVLAGALFLNALVWSRLGRL
jgi:hypothetical protein